MCFFKAKAVADQPARERGGIGLRPGKGLQLGGQFGYGDVIFLRDAAQKEGTVWIEFGLAAAAARLWRDAARRSKSLDQIDRKGRRNAEPLPRAGYVQPLQKPQRAHEDRMKENGALQITSRGK